jgi:hypothetical protein
MAFPSEHIEQVQTVSWFRKTYPGVKIFAIPNGGHRNKITAAKLKAEGVLPGVPDLFVPHFNLWIEMKMQKGGRLSESQKEMRDYLLDQCSHNYLMCEGFDDARLKITNFFNCLDNS